MFLIRLFDISVSSKSKNAISHAGVGFNLKIGSNTY